MINLGFLTEGKSAAILIPTFLLGFPTGWSFTTQQATAFSGAVAGEKSGRPLQGEFSYAHPLLCYCFALLYLFYLHHFISKTQKN
jgi:hypothetical protein